MLHFSTGAANAQPEQWHAHAEPSAAVQQRNAAAANEHTAAASESE